MGYFVSDVLFCKPSRHGKSRGRAFEKIKNRKLIAKVGLSHQMTIEMTNEPDAIWDQVIPLLVTGRFETLLKVN